jgi:hypothetical protein
MSADEIMRLNRKRRIFRKCLGLSYLHSSTDTVELANIPTLLDSIYKRVTKFTTKAIESDNQTLLRTFNIPPPICNRQKSKKYKFPPAVCMDRIVNKHQLPDHLELLLKSTHSSFR